MRYTAKRAYRWSADIAYSVGLMASDGCLQQDGRHLDFTSVDAEQLQNFCAAIGRPLPISPKQNSSNVPAFRIQFSDVAYYDFLLEAGLTPAKSKTIPALSVPEEYYADFLRGTFDGDGTTYAYMDQRWRSSFMFYTAFTSASLAYVYYLQAMNISLIGMSSGSIRVGKTAYNLAYAKADSRLLAPYIYYSPDVLCLTRKRVKLQSFLSQSKFAIL